MITVVTARERTQYTLAWVGIALIVGFFAWFTGTLLYPYNPVPKLSIEVQWPTYAGKELRVSVDYCKADWAVPVEVQWSLVDGVVIMLPPTRVILPNGCHHVVLVLPSSEHMTPARYQLKVVGIYQPWPWRTVPREAVSPIFEVLQ